METNEESQEKRKHLYHIEIHCDAPNPFWIIIRTKNPSIVIECPQKEYVQYIPENSTQTPHPLTEKSIGKMNTEIVLNEIQISIAKALSLIPGINSKDNLISRIYFTHDGMRLILKHHRRDGMDTDLIEKALAPWIEPYYRKAIH